MANELEITLLAQLAVPNSEPVMLLVVKTLPVAVSNTNIVFGPGLEPNPTKLTLDDVIVDADTEVATSEPVMINPLGKLTLPEKYDDVVANDAEMALLAQLAVPNVEPL